MHRLVNVKIPGSGNSENYECSDISYSNSFCLILTSSYLQYFPSYSDVFLPTHCGCRGFIVASSHTQWHTNKHTLTHSVGPLRTSDQPDAETSTWQHKTINSNRHPCHRRDSKPQSQQARGRRSTLATARRLGSKRKAVLCQNMNKDTTWCLGKWLSQT